MFSRRKNSVKTAPVDRSTSAAGATAAQLAFFQKSPNAAPLSSAAAAAALRSHTTSPEPVGNLQTKRMVRRASNSSRGSGSVIVSGGDRPGLVRTGSNSSMTERTFRSPSPGGRNVNSLDLRSAPPVPPLPQTVARPASSLDAPQRMTSPVPAQGKRSSSADDYGNTLSATARRTKRLSNVNEIDEADQAHSTFSKNFSRRDVSPPTSPTTVTTSRAGPVYTSRDGQYAPGATRQGAGGVDGYSTQRSADGSLVSRPRISEREQPSTRTSSMSSLTLGGPVQPYQGTAPISAVGKNYGQHRNYGVAPGTSYEQPKRVYDPNTRSFITQTPPPALQAARRAKSMETVYDPNSRTFVPKYETQYGASTPRSVASESSQSMAPKKQRSFPADSGPRSKNPNRFSSFTVQPRERPISPSAVPAPARAPAAASPPPLRPQPSLVREEQEAERRAETPVSSSSKPVDVNRTAQPQPQPAVLPAKTYASPAAPSAKKERSSSLDVPRGSLDPGLRGRVASESPARSAHFSPSPILKPERHIPPPRDVSPAKSAMKHTPPPSVGRSSPLPPLNNFSSGPASDTSETPSLNKKKSARVSFDENTQQIGTQAPISPPTLRDRSPGSSEDMDDDAIMKPRPALPSFGSVRRPAPAEKVTEMPPERHEASSDRAIGGILKSSSDPVPPEVTSIEGTGYVSDASSDADVAVPSTGARESRQVDEKDVPISKGEPTIRDFASGITDTAIEDGENTDVPSIALLPPTPAFEQKELGEPTESVVADETRGRNSMEGISVPGSWTSDPVTVTRSAPIEPQATEMVGAPTSEPGSTMIAQAIAPQISTPERKLSTEDSAATMNVTPIELTTSPLPLSDIDEDTTDSAEFSDAFEDPSDFEDDGPAGYASLDAIVESPMPSPMDPKTVPLMERANEVPASPTVKRVAKTPEVFTGSVPALIEAANLGGESSPTEPASPTSPANWDEATTYWSQLSKEKRAQIEREALSSDEEPPIPPRKSRPKKTQGASREAPFPTDRTSTEAAPALRKTMRAQSGPTSAEQATNDSRVHIRGTMRTGGTMRPTSREGPPPTRPQSAYVESNSPLQKRSMRPASSGGPPATSGLTGRPQRPQSLISRLSDDSVYSQDGATKRSPPPVPRAKPEPPKPKPEPPKVSARLQKELAKAEDSDSESSFRKRRKGAGAVDASGRYSMRRSMRGGPAEPTPAPSAPANARSSMNERRPESPQSERGGKFGFRSLSPTFGRKADSKRDSSQDSAMKTTLRGSNKAIASSGAQDSGLKTSMRIQPQSKRASQAAPAKKTAATKSRMSSRFADSDDEDIDAPRKTPFRSRFADSDDESDAGSPPPRSSARPAPPAALTPVRGIPRRKGQEDGDSTDLEDEDDNPAATASKRFTALIGPHPGEMNDKIMAAARKNLGISEDSPSAQPQHDVKEGEALSKGSLRKTADPETPQSMGRAKDVEIIPKDKKKKGGFMNSILRRNRDSQAKVPQVAPSSPAQAPVSLVPDPATPQAVTQDENVEPSTPLASPTRERPLSGAGPPTGKLIRRESYEMWKRRTGFSSPPASPGPSTTAHLQTLQERDLTEFIRPKSPPLPEDDPITKTNGDRPTTSDGVSPEAIRLARTMRPDIGTRSQSGPLAQRTVRIQAGEEGSEPGEREPRGVYSQKTGKKKKFGMLRRAFGLND